MDWAIWVEKKNVFIKLTDNQVFTDCEILEYDGQFIKLIDKFKRIAFVNVNNIIKIKDESNENQM